MFQIYMQTFRLTIRLNYLKYIIVVYFTRDIRDEYVTVTVLHPSCNTMAQPT
jgi:hypothetical protein